MRRSVKQAQRSNQFHESKSGFHRFARRRGDRYRRRRFAASSGYPGNGSGAGNDCGSRGGADASRLRRHRRGEQGSGGEHHRLLGAEARRQRTRGPGESARGAAPPDSAIAAAAAPGHGLGLHRRRRRLRAHQRARGRGRGRSARAPHRPARVQGQGGRRRQGDRHRGGEDRGEGTAGGEARRPGADQGRRMGARDRLAVRLREHGDRRHRQRQLALAARRQLRAVHPDRRRGEPGQLRRAALQPEGRGDRHQLADLLAHRRLPGHLVRGPDRRREQREAAAGRARQACSAAASAWRSRK